MEFADVSNKSNTIGNNAALVTTTAVSGSQIFQESQVQFAKFSAWTAASTANISETSTFSQQFVVFRYVIDHEDLLFHEENVAGLGFSGAPVLVFSDVVPFKGTTETHPHSLPYVYGVLRQVKEHLEIQQYEAVTSHCLWALPVVIQKRGETDEEREEQEWDKLLSSPRGQRTLDYLIAEARQQITAGEFEEGGFGLE